MLFLKNHNIKRIFCLITLVLICSNLTGCGDKSESSASVTSHQASSSSNENENNNQESTNQTQYELGETVNAGKDKGFSLNDPITKKDPHYGWKLGKFFVTGYTRVTKDNDGTPVFLKNVGDEVGLYFNLEQAIEKLNNDETLSIAEDDNGYDQLLQVEQQNFGRGTLVVRHKDYQNLESTQVYTDYLSGMMENANTTVELCEEGDYEVALDYEIKNNPRQVKGVDILPTYTDYTIRFKFSVRNGNTMAFLCDLDTGSELINTSFAEKGFYIDWAKSRYLDIDVKKEVLLNAETGETDIRFNRPAQDGEEYTDEGIYTITIRNRYTDTEPTVKTIYVGESMKDYMNDHNKEIS